MSSPQKEKAGFEMKDPPVRHRKSWHTVPYTGMAFGALVLGPIGGAIGLMFLPEFTVDHKVSAILKVLSGIGMGILFGGPIGSTIIWLFRR
ncbi:hypothetical protein WMC41_29680 (plasmid) [Shinella yambaruensis]|uniref:hypothetical protein n=1 Tax=Shinella yambaruensis TaxID=415996 RepID=UPI003D79B993